MVSVALFHCVTDSNLPSGELIVAENEKEMLEKKGCKVNFIKYSPTDFSTNYFGRRLQAAYSNVSSKKAYEFVQENINKFKPDITHFHGIFPYLSISALQAAHDSGKLVIQTLHNGRWICLEGGFYRKESYCNKCVTKGSFNGAIHGCNNGIIASSVIYGGLLNSLSNDRLFKLVDKFIAVSDFIKEQHVLGGFPSEKIVVKNNPIDLEKIKPIINKRNRSGIAFVSRISKAKGTNLLKLLFGRISEPFHVVGDGPELVNLRNYCDRHDYSHVKFWGKLSQEECFNIMSKVSCTLIPSQCGEAFSLVAAESMALETPVVASKVGGLENLVRDSEGGFLANPNRSNEFLDAIQELIRDPLMANQMGKKGKKYITENLNFDLNSEELLSIYNSVLDQRKLY